MATAIGDAMQNDPDWERRARAAIAQNRIDAQKVSDLWLTTFPVHANHYIEELEALLIECRTIKMDAAEKLSSTARKIRNHAGFPENRNACIPCKTEPMDE
jgi:hypothetical protein